VQAQKFGARTASPSQTARLDTTHERLRIMLTDHTTIEARTVVIATGARYRSLPLDQWAEFEGAGIYFAATELEATACGPDPVAVAGGGNSAGQAALYLAGRGNAGRQCSQRVSNVTLALPGLFPRPMLLIMRSGARCGAAGAPRRTRFPRQPGE